MRKIKYLILIIFLFVFIPVIKAECTDSDLNNWASRVTIEKKDYSPTGFTNDKGEFIWTGGKSYAYYLAPSEYREDIYMKATNSFDEEEQESEFFPGYNEIGVGEYTNLEEIKYTVNVYGAKNSACPDELIKTQRITVPPLNKYITTEFCDKYPEHENCEGYKDTSDLDHEKFLEEAKKYEEEHKDEDNRSFSEKLIDALKEYSLFVFIPFIIITIYYSIRINKFKKEQSEK